MRQGYSNEVIREPSDAPRVGAGVGLGGGGGGGGAGRANAYGMVADEEARRSEFFANRRAAAAIKSKVEMEIRGRPGCVYVVCVSVRVCVRVRACACVGVCV